jgi:hypothetical protein
MKIMLFVAGGVLVSIGMFGASNEAKAATMQAIILSPTETLLVTTYKASLLNYDGVIPIGAKLGKNSTHKPLTASFKIEDGDKKKFRGETLGGFILSSQPITQGGYSMPKGEEATLMLVSLISHEATEDIDWRTILTSLPVLVTDNGKITSKATKNF